VQPTDRNVEYAAYNLHNINEILKKLRFRSKEVSVALKNSVTAINGDDEKSLDN